METENIGPRPDCEDLRLKINETAYSIEYLFQQTHHEALTRNELQVRQWQKYRTEHEELSARLLTLRDKLSHTIMVPIGKKALMRGNLVHTNEILICLGDGWFAEQSAKQAADICQRRIQYCDEMLKKFQKEEELLTSRKSFAFDSDVFTGGETQEIIEPYDEEAEKQWKERHRQKEKEYRQKILELKTNQNTKIETEQDLWKRLDDLDVQEELEDELDRMDIEGGEEEDDDDDVEKSDDDTESDANNENDSLPGDVVKEVENSLKRKVSFKEDKENHIDEEGMDCDDREEMIRIFFKHSDNPPTKPSEPSAEITSPSDIYTHYVRQRVPKSILKPSSAELAPPLQAPLLSEDTRQLTYIHAKPSEQAVKAEVQVVEQMPATTSSSTDERPVSRFKAARLAKKR